MVGGGGGSQLWKASLLGQGFLQIWSEGLLVHLE